MKELNAMRPYGATVLPITSAKAWWMRWMRSLFSQAWKLGHRPARQLRLCETLALGERRFVALIEFEQCRYLIGGTSSSLALLATLGSANQSAAISGNCSEEKRD